MTVLHTSFRSPGWYIVFTGRNEYKKLVALSGNNDLL